MIVPFVREIGIAIAVGGTLWIVVHVVRSARLLNASVRAFKAEQEKQNGVVDPYAAMANLYSPPDPPKEEPRKRDRRD